MADALATLFLDIRARSVDLAMDLRKAEKQLTRLGRNLERTGQTITQRFSIPVGLALTAAAREAIVFDKAMVEAFAKIPGMTADMAKFGSSLRKDIEKPISDIAQATSFDLAEVAKGFQRLIEQGFKTEEAIQVLPTLAKFSQAAAIDINEGVDQLIGSATALGARFDVLPGKMGQVQVSSEKFTERVRRLGESLLAVSFNSPATALELMNAIITRGGVEAKQSGQSFEEAAAALGVLAKQGIKEARAGNALGIVLRDLRQKAALNADAWEDLGISVTDTGDNYRDLSSVLLDLETKLGGMTKAGKEVQLNQLGITLKSMASMNALLGMSQAFDELKLAAIDAGGIIEDTQSIQMQALGERLEQLIERFKTIGITVGNIVADDFINLANKVADLAQKFLELDPSTQKFLVRTLAIAAAMGPLTFVFGSFLRLVGGAISLFLKFVPASFSTAKGLMAAQKSGVLFGGALGKIGSGLAALASPIVAATASVGALGAAFWAFTTDVEEMSPRWAIPFMVLQDHFPKTTALLKGLRTAFEETANFFVSKWRLAFEQMNGITEWFSQKTGKSITELTLPFGFLIEKIRDLGAGVSAKFSAMSDDVAALNADYERNLTLSENLAEWGKNNKKTINDFWVDAEISVRNFGRAMLDLPLMTTREEFESLMESYQKAEAERVAQEKRDAEKRKKLLEEQKAAHQQAFDSMTKDLRDFRTEVEKTKIDESIEKMLEDAANAGQSFDAIRDRLAEAYAKAAELSIDPLVRNTKAASIKIQEEVAESLRLAANEYGEVMKQKNEEIAQEQERQAKELQEQQEQAYKESVDFWRSTMENAITGVTFDLEDALKQVAIGFAAELAASLVGGIGSGIGNLKDLGGLLGRELLGRGGAGGAGGGIPGAVGGGFGGGLFSGGGIGSIFSDPGGFFSGLFGQSTGRPDIFGPLTKEQTAAWQSSAEAAGSAAGAMIPLAAVTLTATKAIEDFTAIANGEATKLSTFSQLALAVPTGGLSFLDFGGLFGSGKDADQQVRDGFRAALQDMNLLDGDFILRAMGIPDFNFGAESINGQRTFESTPGGAGGGAGPDLTGFGNILATLTTGQSTLVDLNHQFANMFTNALEGANTTTEAMLAMNDLLKQMGTDAQGAKDKFLDLFLQGEIGLAEFGAGVGNLNQLMQDNIEGEGSIGEALDILANNLGPEGSPQLALKGLELAFKEASEVSSDQLEAVRQTLEERLGPESAGRIIEAFKKAGIKSFEDFNNLSADQVFALFDALSKETDAFKREFTQIMSDTGEDGGKALKEAFNLDAIRGELDSLQDRLEEIDRKRSGGGGGGSGEKPANSYRGNVFTRPGLSFFGERGPEAILPLERMKGGKLGVIASMPAGGGGGSAPLSIYVNAPNAAPGIEASIHRAVRLAVDTATARTLQTVQERAFRG